MATGTSDILELLAQLDPDQRKIVLDPTVSHKTKAALMAGGLSIPTTQVVPILHMLDRINATTTPAATPVVAATPVAAMPVATYNPADVQDVVNMLSGGGNDPEASKPRMMSRALTEPEIDKMERAMADLLATVTGETTNSLTGGGGSTHDGIMASVLSPAQYDHWTMTRQIRNTPAWQRMMLADLALGHSLSRVLTRQQMRTISAGGKADTTLRQRYVASDLLRATDRQQQQQQQQVRPMLLWGAALDYPPTHDMVL